MSKEFLTDVLEKFAQVTSIIVETCKIKEDLDNNCNSSDENLKDILERTKGQVENLLEHATSLKDFFYKQQETSENSSAVNGKEDVNANTSEENDSLTDPAVNNSSENGTGDKTAPRTKPLIKLIDIKKLVEPRTLIKKETSKQPRIVAVDDTVVIITSSDEESPKTKTVAAKTTNVRTTSRRKAAKETIKKTKKSLELFEKSESESSEKEISKARSTRTRNGNRKKGKQLEKVTLSDTSSLSDDSTESESVRYRRFKKKKDRLKEKREDSEPEVEQADWKNDPKFKAGCYVDVVRIPCEKLKEYYLEKLELLEVNKLRDINSLKRKRRRSVSKTSSSSSSSSSEESRRKKRKDKSKTPQKEVASEKQDSDATEEDLVASKDGASSPVLPASDVSPDLTSKDTADADQIAEDALNLLNSDQEGDKDDSSEENLLNSDKEGDKGASPEEEPSSEKNSEEMEAPKEKDVGGDKETTEDDTQNQAEKDDAQNLTGKDDAQNEIEKDDVQNEIEKDQAQNENNEEIEKDKDETPTEKEASDKEDEMSNDENEREKEKGNKDDNAKKSWRKDKLLTMQLDSSDSEEELKKFQKKKDKMDEKITSDDEEPKLSKDKKKRLVKKRMKKAILSDSDSDKKKDSDFQESSKSSSSSSESEKDEKEDKEEEQPKRRRRVKRVHDSSEDDDEKSTRKQIRNIWSKDSLADSTKKAEAEENARKARISEKQKKYNQIYETDLQLNAKVEKVVLDFDEKNEKELLRVDDDLVEKLKPHQASGIQFMWDACFESLERAKKTTGSGCIIAHCMGLGKTLQVIALSHTLLVNSEETKVKKILVVCPLNTVLNWVSEFKQWLPDNDDYEVFEVASYKQNYERQYQVKSWHDCGGVLIIGYDMFRNLSNPENKRLSKKMRQVFQEALVDPGADLVICDEGHLLKNEKTNLSIAMNRIKTLRRIVLTGTPLQNNLKEYFCMVQFIKPNLLGTYKEYLNRFVNPITNGQYTDSTQHDIQIMRRRSHVLHKMLDGVVQRRDYAVLAPYLPPKHEYVLFLNLTETQIKLYQHYMDHFSRGSASETNRTSFLFVDYQALQRICTHPRVLLDKSIEMRLAKDKKDDEDSEDDSEGSLKDFINDDEEEAESTPSSNSSSDEEGKKKSSTQRKRVTRAAAALAKENGESEPEIIELTDGRPAEKEWWQQYCDGDELNVIAHSSKLFLLFEILKECEQIGDKVLVFSQSLYSLNIIEYFLGRVHDATQNNDLDSVGGYTGSWCLGLDYFRLDGSSSCDNRAAWCKTFNSRKNTRARLFLISTRAGGLGINLVAANRVIIFDVSWNPSHDIQSIYRVYRFGQTKPCYIYRFVTLGTMEMKIYERQVTKQAISKRVIDEQQIDRHYNQNDLAELYRFEPNPGDRPIPLVPKDVLLGELLQKYENRIYKYHEHQSLLENKEEEGLNEEERKAAWEEFENEKKQRSIMGNSMVRANNMELALANVMRRENPTWPEAQIKAALPIWHAQLQEEIARKEYTLWIKVQQEVQMLYALQNLQNQKIKEQLYQQQVLKVMQQQQQRRQMAEAMKQHGAGGWADSYMNMNQIPGTSRTAAARTPMNANEVIDLE